MEVKRILSSWLESRIVETLLYVFHTSLCVKVKAYCVQFLSLIFEQKF